jgi:aspartyl-tRNA(Asn)/glutamyl-tRNA(Gln) amidotransferase subunit C
MISEDDIEKLASLARLELKDSMRAIMAGQVNSILEYVRQLGEVNTSDVPPMSHTNASTNVMRADEVVPASSQADPKPLGDTAIPKQAMLGEDDLFKNAPDRSGPFIRVPLIIE